MSEIGDVTKEPESSLHYDRFGDFIRLRVKDMTITETRCLIAGLWAGLDERCRNDVMAELAHYTDHPYSPMAPIALSVRQAKFDSEQRDGGDAAVDVKSFMKTEGW